MVAASVPVPLGPWWSTDLQGPHTLRGSEGIPKSPVFSCTRRSPTGSCLTAGDHFSRVVGQKSQRKQSVLFRVIIAISHRNHGFVGRVQARYRVFN